MFIESIDEGRYIVSLTTGSRGQYLVDINAYAGNGCCACKDFEYRHMPELQRQLEAGEPITRSRCKHLRLLHYKLESKSKDAAQRPEKEVEVPEEDRHDES